LDDNVFEIDSDNDDYDSVSIYSERTTKSIESSTSQNTNTSNPNKMTLVAKFEFSSTSSSTRNIFTKICNIINNEQWWSTINNLA
ncbi:2735_t:CDS:2, partial [Dentiscutata erythropus]